MQADLNLIMSYAAGNSDTKHRMQNYYASRINSSRTACPRFRLLTWLIRPPFQPKPSHRRKLTSPQSMAVDNEDNPAVNVAGGAPPTTSTVSSSGGAALVVASSSDTGASLAATHDTSILPHPSASASATLLLDVDGDAAAATAAAAHELIVTDPHHDPLDNHSNHEESPMEIDNFTANAPTAAEATNDILEGNTTSSACQARTTVSQRSRALLRVQNPSVTIPTMVSCEFSTCTFEIRAIRPREIDLVVVVGGQAHEVYLLRIAINLDGCYIAGGTDASKLLQFVCHSITNNTNISISCSCERHITSGTAQGGCPGTRYLEKHLQDHPTTAHLEIELNCVPSIVRHGELCWSVVVECQPTVLVKQGPRNQCYSCTGLAVACRTIRDAMCMHRTAVSKFNETLPTEISEMDYNSDERTPFYYDPQSQEFQLTQDNHDLSSDIQPILYLPRQTETGPTRGYSMPFSTGIPQDLTPVGGL